MLHIEDDITKQLHLCVALMSDPLIMREQSAMVADHFKSAMNKIEQLQMFLRPPDDVCARHDWLDSSILTVGVKRMVALVLAKQMEPMHWKTPKQLRCSCRKNDHVVENPQNSAPQVFDREFRQDEDDKKHNQCDETLLAREIKETNCMASLVLLYYYLNWHILLIMLNFINHPCIGGRDSERVLDFDKLLKNLPGMADTFELRSIREFMHTDHMKEEKMGADEAPSLDSCSSDDDGSHMTEGGSGVEEGEEGAPEPSERKGTQFDAYTLKVSELLKRMIGSGALNEFMSSVSPDDNSATLITSKNYPDGKHRKGSLMPIYRMIIGVTHHNDTSDAHLKNAFAACCGTFNQDMTAEKNKLLDSGKLRDAVMLAITQTIVAARSITTIQERALNSGVHSVYNLQDDTQRWFDMYKPIEISCITSDDGKEFGVQPTQKKYTPTLGQILDNDPYSRIFLGENVKTTKMLCIHDFNLSSLMMDVSRSYLKLHDLIMELKHGKNDLSEIKKKLFVFILQTYASDRAISKFLKSEIKSEIIDVEHPLMKSGWLSIPAGNHKKVSIANREMLDDLVIDEVAGHYWGSRLSNYNSVNHRYFAWPTFEDGSYRRALKLIQSTLASTHSNSLHGRFMFIVEPALRNSLFIHPMIQSLLLLINMMGCSPLMDNNIVTIKDSDTIHGPGYKMKDNFNRDESVLQAEVPAGGEDGDGHSSIAPASEAAVSEMAYISPYTTEQLRKRKQKFEKYLKMYVTFNMNKSKLVSDLRAELSALSSRVTNVSKGEFKLYGGTSWPVVDGKLTGGATNVPIFGKGVHVPRMVSGSRLTDAVEHLADLAAKGGRPA